MLYSKKDVDALINKRLSELNNTTEDHIHFENKNGNKYYKQNDGYVMSAPHVPFVAYASFVECYSDEYDMNDNFTTKQYVVDKIGKGRYISFTVKGDSMDYDGRGYTPDGADVLAREVGRHLWQDGFRSTDYGFIIVTYNGIYHKDIVGINKQGCSLVLSSRNKDYENFEVNLLEVHSIYHVIKRTF